MSLKSALQRSLPASLRGQFTLAFAALSLLLLIAGGASLATLQRAVQDIRTLTEARLVLMQASQELLRNTVAIDRNTSEVLQATSSQQLAQAMAGMGSQLDAFDETVQHLAADAGDSAMLDLYQASQLIRNSANIVAQLRDSELNRLQSARVAVEQPVIVQVHDELRHQADALVSAADAQSARLTQDYRVAVQRLAQTTQRTQYTVLVLMSASLVLAVLIARLLGRLVLRRLHAVSQRLLSDRSDPPAPAAAVRGHDEIGRMAHAVERFLFDRQQLQLRSAQLVEAQQRIETRNLELCHEIQERQSAQRALAEQVSVLELIATNTPLPQVLERLCRLIEARLPGTLASVLLLDEDGLHLHHGAGPSLPPAYLEAIDGVAIGAAVGSCGTAAYRREHVIVEDIETDTLWAPDYKQLASAHGLRSCWSWPVMSHGGAVLGTFALYKRVPGPPSTTESETVGLATHLAGIAIERHVVQQRIHHLAHHDALTGLANRLGLQERLQFALAQAARNGCGVSLAYIDLDNFKDINDSLGHATGDEVLREVARRLQRSVRGADAVARQGGDEFLVIFTDQPDDPTVLAPRLQALREAVAQPLRIGERSYRVTCSIGVAHYPRDARDADDLLSCADIALYRAKDVGRDVFQFYSAGLDAHVQDQLAMREDLRQAIERDELRLVYQPQVDLKTGRLFGVEALLRWHHPQRGMVSPATFIPLAESSGLIVPIGDWVLRTACRQNKAWLDAGLPPITVAVNVSARQLREADWSQRVADALADTGLQPQYLEIELTESMIMENMEPAVAHMRALNDMGVGISIDDFGTGYSSLGALKTFPLSRLKIDRSFVRAMHEDGGLAIVEAIVSLGHKLRLKVLAEGVETPAERELLRAIGCDEIQGFLYSKPVSQADIEALVRAQDLGGDGHQHSTRTVVPTLTV
jgi:diguanylate cyclase (GGDEF)-like protein